MEHPIRVLVLDTVMDRGGAETMIMNYMRKMDRNKIQYDFLVHREYKAAYEDEIVKLGGKIYRICPPYPQNYFKYEKEIKKLFFEHPEYKIIHCNMMEMGYFAYKAAKESGIPVRICHSHIANFKEVEKGGARGIIKNYYKRHMNKYITHRFTCGREAAQWLFGTESSDEVYYMRNAIDANEYRYKSEVETEVRNEFNLGNRFVVGHVGRFFKQKNHTFIIDVFQEVVKRVPDAMLVMVGGGETDDKTMNQTKEKVCQLGLEDNVIFTGVREDVNRILQAFDVFILPSLAEGFPVVMVEAQAAGLKCIISDKVPKECDITGNVKVVPLEVGARIWAEEIALYNGTNKKRDMYQNIVNVGYDINTNVRMLEAFYEEALMEQTL